MTPTLTRYTPADDDIIRDMVRDGETDQAIADELGRTLLSVASRRRTLRKNGVKPKQDGKPGVERLNDAKMLKKRMAGPPVKVDRRMVVLQLLRTGLSVNKIAKKLGTSSSPLCRLLRRMEQDKLVRRQKEVIHVTRWLVVEKRYDTDTLLQGGVTNPKRNGKKAQTKQDEEE